MAAQVRRDGRVLPDRRGEGRGLSTATAAGHRRHRLCGSLTQEEHDAIALIDARDPRDDQGGWCSDDDLQPLPRGVLASLHRWEFLSPAPEASEHS